MNLTKQFFKYVSQNIFGLLGTSCYILADTYFISQAAGTDGVTLLNLCLPIYNFIFAIGSMIGLGAATRYAILRAQGEERAAQRSEQIAASAEAEGDALRRAAEGRLQAAAEFIVGRIVED